MESKPLRGEHEPGDPHREPAPPDVTSGRRRLRLVVRKLQLPVRPRGVLAE